MSRRWPGRRGGGSGRGEEGAGEAFGQAGEAAGERGWRRRRVAEIERELADHVERRTRALMASGLEEGEARAEAWRRLGDVERIQAECLRVAERQRLRARLASWGGDLRQGVRAGLRALRREPGFAVTAVGALALAIGLATAVFSAVDAVLLRSLPYPESGRVVRVYNRWEGTNQAAISPAEYFDYVDGSHAVFSALGAYAYPDAVSVTGAGEAERVAAAYVTSGALAALGAWPVRGRRFTAEEDAPGSPAVVMLGHGYWQRRFGGRDDIVGRRLVIDGEAATVVGILPAGFTVPDGFRPGTAPDLYLPLVMDRTQETARGSHFLALVGRLAPDVTRQQAGVALAGIARRFVATFPDDYPRDMRFGVYPVPIAQDIVGSVRGILLVLLGAVGCVVLVAAANVAGLLLTRGEGRRREFAVRRALGAGGGQLFRQLLGESLVLGSAAGLVGMALALLGTRALAALRPPGIPRLDNLGFSPLLLWFAAGLTAAVVGALGLLPAVAVSGQPFRALRESDRTASASRAGTRLRRGLIVGELALALVLLAGAGVLLRSMVALLRVDPGYTTEHVLTTRLSLPLDKYDTDEARRAYFSALVAGVRVLPGVMAVGAVSNLPLTRSLGDLNIHIEGRPVRAGEVSPRLDWQVVTPGYFRTMGMHILQGRGITDRDDERSPGVVVINQAAARLYFAGEDPLGKRFLLGGDAGPGWVTVVGVVNDVRHGALFTPPEAQMYLAHRQFRFWNGGSAVPSMTLVVRTAGQAQALAPPVRRVVAGLDANVPPGPFETMDRIAADAVAGPRFALVLLGTFAGTAVLLAVLGIYSVIAYAVSRRRRELGIRMALGARRSQMTRLVLRQGMALVGVGLLVGLAGALALTRTLSGLLYQVAPTDPITLGAVTVVLGTAAVGACAIPAGRATRLNPATTLRGD